MYASCEGFGKNAHFVTNIIHFTDDLCIFTSVFNLSLLKYSTGPRSAVGNVSGYRCVSDCRSRGREFDPSPVPYFRGD